MCRWHINFLLLTTPNFILHQLSTNIEQLFFLKTLLRSSKLAHFGELQKENHVKIWFFSTINGWFHPLPLKRHQKRIKNRKLTEETFVSKSADFEFVKKKLFLHRRSGITSHFPLSSFRESRKTFKRVQ
jgi:hypothetical protein